MTERLMNELLDASNGLGASREASRGHPQDGRGQPRLRPLPLVITDQLSIRTAGHGAELVALCPDSTH